MSKKLRCVISSAPWRNLYSGIRTCWLPFCGARSMALVRSRVDSALVPLITDWFAAAAGRAVKARGLGVAVTAGRS